MSRKRKRYNDALQGYVKAQQDVDAAIAGVIIWASKLADARDRGKHYLRRINGLAPQQPRVIVSPATAIAVDKIKEGASRILDRAGLELPSEDGSPRPKGSRP